MFFKMRSLVVLLMMGWLIGGSPARAAARDPKAFCAALLPAVQALVKPQLTIFSAEDATADAMHSGEQGYVSCVFANGANRVSVTMSDSPDKRFTAEPKKGYEPLSGFGDLARSAHSSFDWVDVMKGVTFCEAIVAMKPAQLNPPDWKQVGGKACLAAYATR